MNPKTAQKKCFGLLGTTEEIIKKSLVRGLKAINSDQSIVPDYRGWMIHDCWSSYFKYQRVKHALCGSHLLRELQALIENDSIWAKRMHALLLYAYHDSEKGKFCLHNTQASTQCLR